MEMPTTIEQPVGTIAVPFVVCIDSREQNPFIFKGLLADAAQKQCPLFVPTIWKGLKTGDYSIEGYEDLLTVERKSAADLFGSLGQGRDRFQAEHERMKIIVQSGGYAAVIVEADWNTILLRPPKHSRLNPKTVFRTAIAWQQRYGVQWLAMGSRRLAEVTTFRVLERFWKDHLPTDESE